MSSLQIVHITTNTGRILQFIGPEALAEGERAVRIVATEPMPVPDGYSWEEIFPESEAKGE